MDPVSAGIMIALAGGAGYMDYRNAKSSDKAQRRTSKIAGKYGNITSKKDWEKLGRSGRHKFAADYQRAQRSNPNLPNLGSSKEQIRKNAKSLFDKGGFSGVGGVGGGVQQLPNFSKSQLKALERMAPGVMKAISQRGLYSSSAGKASKQLGQEAIGIDPQYGAAQEAAMLAGLPISFEEGALQNYGSDITSRLSEQLTGKVSKNYLENILPDIKSAYAGQMDSSAYQQAVRKSQEDLTQDLGGILAELGLQGEQLGMQKGDQELRRRALGLDRARAALQAKGVGLDAINMLTGVRERGLNQWLGTTQQDISNRQGKIDRFLARSPYTYMSSSGGFSNPYTTAPADQRTNYLGNILGPLAGGFGRYGGEQLARGIFG